MNLFDWVKDIFPLLLSGKTNKIEAVIDHDEDHTYAVSAYRVVEIIRIDIKPTPKEKS